MRKLLDAIYGMLKNDSDFDGERFYALREATRLAPQDKWAGWGGQGEGLGEPPPVEVVLPIGRSVQRIGTRSVHRFSLSGNTENAHESACNTREYLTQGELLGD